MNNQTIVCCVVALLLGMLLANMLKNVCGCKLVEGQMALNEAHCSCRAPGFPGSTTDSGSPQVVHWQNDAGVDGTVTCNAVLPPPIVAQLGNVCSDLRQEWVDTPPGNRTEHLDLFTEFDSIVEDQAALLNLATRH